MELVQPQTPLSMPPGGESSRASRQARSAREGSQRAVGPHIAPVRGDQEAELALVRSAERMLAIRQAMQHTARVRPRERDERIVRAINVGLAAVAIVVTFPVMLVVALLVWLTSPGPVLYTQERVGLDRRRGRMPAIGDRRASDHGGQLFTIYKFRSMRIDAERNGAVWATQNDPRVTPVGRVIRKLRLDELPQLFNVLKGDMNIVGPRPERPSIFRELRENIAEYPLRQQVKPGITGWAQINLMYDTCVDDVRSKVRYDLEYIERQSVLEDLRIMAKTIPVMIFRKTGW